MEFPSLSVRYVFLAISYKFAANSILPDYENEFSDDEDSEQPSTEILSPTTPQKSALQDFIYFKITKAVPPTSRQNTISPEEENARPPILWIDKKITTLLQEGAVNSRIPPHTHLQTSVPPGISEPFLSFVSLLEPCLHPMSASLGIKSPTILLRGPRGLCCLCVRFQRSSFRLREISNCERGSQKVWNSFV